MPGNPYIINIENQSFACSKYEKITFDVPVERTAAKITVLKLSGVEKEPVYVITQKEKSQIIAAMQRGKAARCWGNDAIYFEFFVECKLKYEDCRDMQDYDTDDNVYDDPLRRRYSLKYGLLYDIAEGGRASKRVFVSPLETVIRQFTEQKQRVEEAMRLKREKIRADFNAAGLLAQSSLPPRQKLEEIERVKAFCRKTLPELDNRDFHIVDLSGRCPDLDAGQCETFARNWSKLLSACSILRSGIQGEDKVAEVLTLVDDKLCFLRNYRWGCEHDFVVLTPYGIFTLEVKTLRGDYILTETGMLKSRSDPKAKGKDVVFQSKKHVETLRRNLKGCPAFHSGIPLRPVICSGEGDFTIRNQFPDIPVCYYNTIDRVLLPEPAPEPVLTENEIETLREFLLEHQEDEWKYDLFAPQGELDSREAFLDSFAAVAAAVQCFS